MNAIIICGGLSTRLGDITKSIPKVLLDIKGRTVLDWQIEKFKQVGIDEIVLAAGHLSDVLFENIGTKHDGINITYSIEKTRLGTGGAIKRAFEYVGEPDQPTLILNGDILTGVELPAMYERLNKKSDGLILGAKVDDAASYGTLVYGADFHLKEFKEKEGKHQPGYINGGFYIFTPEVKKYFPKQENFSIEHDVFPFMKNLYVYESDEPWIDIGVPERLAWARENWQE